MKKETIVIPPVSETASVEDLIERFCTYKREDDLILKKLERDLKKLRPNPYF